MWISLGEPTAKQVVLLKIENLDSPARRSSGTDWAPVDATNLCAIEREGGRSSETEMKESIFFKAEASTEIVCECVGHKLDELCASCIAHFAKASLTSGSDVKSPTSQVSTATS